MGEFAVQAGVTLQSPSAEYYEQLRNDIEQCAARLVAAAQPPPVVERFDRGLLAELSSELAKALKEAGDNALRLVNEHHADFPESPLFCSCTLLRPLGQSRKEVSVTQVLGWLFDPNAEHGFRGRLLREFLSMLKDGSEAARNLLGMEDRDISVYTEFSIERNRADIVIASRGNAVVIEAKVDAREGRAQTERYSSSFGKTFPECTFVYLTPKGSKALVDDFGSLRYLDVARALLPALKAGRTNEGFPYARYFVAGMLNDLCNLRTSNVLDEVLQGNSFELEILLEGHSHG